MKIWTSEDDFDLRASVVAMGMFDGVHLGHQALIRRAKQLSGELDAACVVYTFDRHPLSVIAPERAPQQLIGPDEKLAKFEKLGVDGVLLKSFTAEYAATDPTKFLELLTEKLQVRALVCGFNYTFGAGGRGNAELIRREARRLQYRAEIVDAVVDAGDTVSSTLIRSLLESGENRRAERLLALQCPPVPTKSAENS